MQLSDPEKPISALSFFGVRCLHENIRAIEKIPIKNKYTLPAIAFNFIGTTNIVIIWIKMNNQSLFRMNNKCITMNLYLTFLRLNH